MRRTVQKESPRESGMSLESILPDCVRGGSVQKSLELTSSGESDGGSPVRYGGDLVYLVRR